MENQNNKAEEPSLKDYIINAQVLFKHFMRNWKIWLTCGILGATLGLFMGMKSKPTYISELTFSVVEKSGGMGGLGALAGQFGISTGSSEAGMFSSNNMIELLKSKHLIEAALLTEYDNGTLVDYLIATSKGLIINEADKAVKFPLNVHNFTRQQDSILLLIDERLQANIKIIKLGKDVSIIKMVFKSKNEKFAKIFTERLISVTSDFYVDSKTKLTVSNIASMQQQADSLRNRYEKALFNRAIAADKNMNSVKQIVSIEQQKYIADVQLFGASYAELVKNIEILKLDLARETPLIQVMDTPKYPLKYEKLGKARGIIIGGFIGGILALCYIFGLYYYRKTMI